MNSRLSEQGQINPMKTPSSNSTNNEDDLEQMVEPRLIRSVESFEELMDKIESNKSIEMDKNITTLRNKLRKSKLIDEN